MRQLPGRYRFRRVVVSAAIASLALVLHFTVEAAWFSLPVREGGILPRDILWPHAALHCTYLEFLWEQAAMSPWHTAWLIALSGAVTYLLLSPDRLRLASWGVGWLVTFAVVITQVVVRMVSPWWVPPWEIYTFDWSSVYPLSWVVSTIALAGTFFVMWHFGRVLGSRTLLSAGAVWIWIALWLLSAGVALWLPLAPGKQIWVDYFNILAYSSHGLVAGVFLGWGSGTEADEQR